MLLTRIIVIDFGEIYSRTAIIKRLNTLGYLRNTKIHPKRKTIYFEYTSFRDKDAALMELRKMGVLFKTANNEGEQELKANTIQD